MKEDNFVKINVSYYIPGLIKLIGNNIFDWDSINDLFEEELIKRVEKIAEKKSETILIEASIYDIIVEVKKQNKGAIRLLDFFNKLMVDLDLTLTHKEKKLIIPNIRNILTAFDKRYIDFTAELAVLNNILKSKAYQLYGVEIKLPNKKTLDFKLRKVSDGKFLSVEIVSIHLNRERINSDETLIKKFLTDRLGQKINSKKLGLIENINFFLVPVIWGETEGLKIYSDYFQKNKMHLENVTEPVSYLSFTDPNVDFYFVHRFANISNLFKSS